MRLRALQYTVTGHTPNIVNHTFFQVITIAALFSRPSAKMRKKKSGVIISL